MNLDRYQQLYNYLESEILPDDLTKYQQKQIMNQSRFFEIRHHLLYKKNRKDSQQPLRVIKWTEVEPILYMMHKHPTAGHLGTNAMFYKIAERYYWDQMYRDIKEYVKTCEECQKRLISKRVRILCEKFLITHKFSSVYHPQTNGMVERLNRTLCESLAKVKGTDE